MRPPTDLTPAIIVNLSMNAVTVCSTTQKMIRGSARNPTPGMSDDDVTGMAKTRGRPGEADHGTPTVISRRPNTSPKFAH